MKSLKNRIYPLCLSGVLLLAALAQGKDLTLYVATNGNDAWQGLLAEPAADGQDGPLATLPAALAAVRKARQAAGGEFLAAQIKVRGGLYELSQPLVFTPADSGCGTAAPLLVTANLHEKPVFSGGRRITGWTPVPDRPGVWRTEVPEVRSGQWYFRQLFVDGQRQQRARTPNQGFFRIQGASPQDHPVKLKYRAGDIDKAWAALGDVEVVANLAWADFRLFIRSVDEDSRVAVLSGDPKPSNREDNAQYYVENAPGLLDTPGEWYLDRKTGVLTWWGQPGADPNRLTVIAPRLTELCRFAGDFAGRKPVEFVTLRGLTFAHSDWELAATGYADTQAAIDIRGDVHAEGAVDCAIEYCRFEHLGGYALELAKGCQRFKVAGNEMTDLGGGGVRVGETAIRTSPFEMNHGHEIVDNEIHRLGRIYTPAIGVLVLQSGRNRIAHNHIHDLFYTAISVGWNWGYQETPCRENRIEFNHLHDIGQGILSDMGAIYTLGIQRGTVIRNNLIHDVNAFTYGGWGIYPDEGSTDLLIENNVVYRTKSAGFHQHYGRENLVRNNIFALGREHQLMRTRAEAHLSFTFERNLVYFDSGSLLGSNWSGDHYRMRSNLYFDARPGQGPDTLKLDGKSWAAWRQTGQDADSLVADPLFVDPARNDFSLKPGSPAFKLGFQPIDLTTVGVRRSHP